MFNTKDTLFGKKDEAAPKDYRASSATSSASTPQRAPSSVMGHADTATAGAAVAGDAMPVSGTAGANAPGVQSGSKLIVGPDIKLKGVEITDCDTLVVEGRVEATMDSRVIQNAEHGVYSGTVGIDVAEIHGRFEGELTARKQLIIHATGRVSGTIRYGKLTLEDGGEISGTISTLSGQSNGASLQREKGSHANILSSHDSFVQTAAQTAKPATPPH